MYIEIITTPNEALKESGFGSLKACNSVLTALQGMDYSVRLNVCKTRACLENVVQRRPALVILAVKYIPLDDGDIWLSDYFARQRVNFTGSVREVLEFDSNKVLAKTHLLNKGVATASYFIARPGQYKQASELPIKFPLFLKPLDAANGNGIDDQSFVTCFADYESKVAALFETFNQPVLVEEYMDGPEFTVAVIKARNGELLVSAVEIIPPLSSNGLRILGAQAKKEDSEQLVAIVDNEVKKQVKAVAIEAFNTLGIRDFGRVDIKTNHLGEYFFMEANLVPGMTRGSSYFPQACAIEHQLAYPEVVELMLENGIARASTTLPPYRQPGSDDRLFAAI